MEANRHVKVGSLLTTRIMDRIAILKTNHEELNSTLPIIPDESQLMDQERTLEPLTQGFQLQYENHNGRLYQGNSLDWLESLEEASVDLVFADPPYNLKKADWDDFESQEKYIEWSIHWIKQVSRILKPTGAFYVCGFSEILADLKHPVEKYFKSCRWLIWHFDILPFVNEWDSYAA